MNHDGTEYQKHFSHACDADRHFFLSFFEEAFLKLLKRVFGGYRQWNPNTEFDELCRKSFCSCTKSGREDLIP